MSTRSCSRYGSMYSGEDEKHVQGDLGLSRSMAIAKRALVGRIPRVEMRSIK